MEQLPFKASILPESRYSAMVSDNVESIFRDYRGQGGVKLPFVIAIARLKAMWVSK
jgi:hypothetical protein